MLIASGGKLFKLISTVIKKIKIISLIMKVYYFYSKTTSAGALMHYAMNGKPEPGQHQQPPMGAGGGMGGGGMGGGPPGGMGGGPGGGGPRGPPPGAGGPGPQRGPPGDGGMGQRPDRLGLSTNIRVSSEYFHSFTQGM